MFVAGFVVLGYLAWMAYESLSAALLPKPAPTPTLPLATFRQQPHAL